MAILEFAGMVIIVVLAVRFLVKVNEQHVEWKYKLERKKHDDEQTDKLIDGEK